jgi:16S rRNA A1518/A1519 N6-dimethyltransferase RsmA/KsgA/DIM1 with predicted DNA glycosylase/AP lyase activity
MSVSCCEMRALEGKPSKFIPPPPVVSTVVHQETAKENGDVWGT